MIYQRRMTVLTAGATLTYSQMGDVIVNASGAVTLTLPAPNSNLWYLVGSVGSGTVTISYNSTGLTALKTGEQALFVCNGSSGWWMTRGGSTYELTKAAVEGVLTGEINTHTHPAVYEIPVGGTIGQVLLKASEVDRVLTWGDVPAATNGIPTGGADNQILAKKSATDFDVQWLDAPAAVNGLPTGGAINQILAKKSATDFDVQWLDAPAAANGIPIAGSTGQVLKKVSNDNYDVTWADEIGGSPSTLEESVWGGL